MSMITVDARPGGRGRVTGRGKHARRWLSAAAVVAVFVATWAISSGAPALATGTAASQADAAPASPASQVVPVPQADSAPAPAPAPPAPELIAPPAMRLAVGLLDTIPPGTRLALRPLAPHETGLRKEVGRRLYESILNAVFQLSRAGGVVVLPRESLGKIYESLDEFGQGNVESMLREAQADIEVKCEVFSVAEGVELSCGAWDLKELFFHARAMERFPLERRVARLEIVVAEIARRFAEEAPAVGELRQVMIMDASLGARGDLGTLLGELLEGELIQRMSERAESEEEKRRVAEALGTEPEPPVEALSYRLDGTILRLDDERIRLEARLKHCGRVPVAAGADAACPRHRGRALVAAGVDIAVSSLPAHLASGVGGGAGPGGTYEAVAEAVVSERLDRESALRAARNLARARVVAQALGLPPPGVTEVKSEGDAIAAFVGFLDQGLPVDERFGEALPEGDAGPEERVAVRLTARVVPVGSVVRPEVRARLEHSVYRAMEPMRIEVRSEERAYLGVFAWGADDKVVRLYPRGAYRIVIGPGETLDIPRRGEGQILSAPLPVPGNREDHEAFVVVASPNPIDFGLARVVGGTVADTMSAAEDGSIFLARLAEQDPARLRIIWLPYQVHE